MARLDGMGWRLELGKLRGPSRAGPGQRSDRMAGEGEEIVSEGLGVEGRALEDRQVSSDSLHL